MPPSRAGDMEVWAVFLPFLLMHFLSADTAYSSQLCHGPTAGGSATNQSSEMLCAILCSKTDTCSTYLYKSPESFASSIDNQYEGNCVFKDKFEDSSYLNEEQDTGDFEVKHCVRVNADFPKNKYFVANPKGINVGQVWRLFLLHIVTCFLVKVAHENGFNLTIEVPSLKVKRFFSVTQISAHSRRSAEQKCAETGGTLVRTYCRKDQ